MQHLPEQEIKKEIPIQVDSDFDSVVFANFAMLGDLMERSSLAEALDKVSSDVTTQNAQGLDALKAWLEARGWLRFETTETTETATELQNVQQDH